MVNNGRISVAARQKKKKKNFWTETAFNLISNFIAMEIVCKSLTWDFPSLNVTVKLTYLFLESFFYKKRIWSKIKVL
jgi:hypothetical protein